MPAPLADDEPLITRISDSMFRAEVSRLTGADPQAHEERAFSLLREGLTRTVLEHKELPGATSAPTSLSGAAPQCAST